MLLEGYIRMSTATHEETKTLKVGDVAPDFTLKTNNREDWHLSDLRGKKNVVLAFVPFAFSKVCSAQLPSYEVEFDRFKDFDTEVVSVSMDSTHALNAGASR
jgi:mycoredoxin-dependent peroxiredoxin